MRVLLRVVWWTEAVQTKPTWPEGWPLPRIGDEVHLPDGSEAEVTSVTWYPNGEHGDNEPFVYVVLRS
jgi:hypothetical protein